MVLSQLMGTELPSPPDSSGRNWAARFRGRAARDVYRDTLVQLAKDDRRIFCLDSDVGGLETAFAAVLPDQYADMGIAEANMISVAAGLAKAGKIPFVNTFATFASCRSCEQIKVDVGLNALPVKLVCTHSGLSAGHLGPTHHCLEDLAILRAIPNLTLIVPSDAAETEKVIASAVLHPGPVYVRLGRKPTPLVHSNDFDFAIGKASVLRLGTDVAIFACGPTAVHIALEAAIVLETGGISARIINMHTIKPLDVAEVIWTAKTIGRLITIEEHSVIGGLGSAVAEVLADSQPCPLARIGTPDRFPERVGSEATLLTELGVSLDAVLMRVQALLRS